MQIYTLPQTGNHTSSPPLSFLQAGCHSCRQTNRNLLRNPPVKDFWKSVKIWLSYCYEVGVSPIWDTACIYPCHQKLAKWSKHPYGTKNVCLLTYTTLKFSCTKTYRTHFCCQINSSTTLSWDHHRFCFSEWFLSAFFLHQTRWNGHQSLENSAPEKCDGTMNKKC